MSNTTELKTKFEELASLDVSKDIEKKGKFNYLSWASAVEIFTKQYPTWKYEIINFDNKPFQLIEGVGCMIYTKISIENETKMMWLPVMDYQNKAKLKPDIMDINKTIMRCLVKNMAMFGLGLYIYKGDDLPEEEKPDEKKQEVKKEEKPVIKISIEEAIDLLKATTSNEELVNVFKNLKPKINGKDIVDFLAIELSKEAIEKAKEVAKIIEAKDMQKNELTKE